jgi:hypothetical protein
MSERLDRIKKVVSAPTPKPKVAGPIAPMSFEELVELQRLRELRHHAMLEKGGANYDGMEEFRRAMYGTGRIFRK